MATRSDAEPHGLLEAAGFTDVDDAETLADGWQVSDFAEAGPRGVAGLVRRTGAPAVMVSFLDSDVGFVEAVTPDGAKWKGLLNRATAQGYGIPLEQFPVESAVTGAPAWSAAAGVAADEELVRRALTGSALFAEELSALLFVALGIPGARLPAPEEDEE